MMPDARKAPLVLTTARLVFRKPVIGDAEPIFKRYASDRDALKYISWPAHESILATRSFREVSFQSGPGRAARHSTLRNRPPSTLASDA